MAIIIDKKQQSQLNQISFGHHGQISIVLLQIRYYFVYKGQLSFDKEQMLLRVICLNIKHFIAISKNQKFLPYETNAYSYYKEKIFRKENCKKLFLDLLAHQILLSKEYERILLNSGLEYDIDIKQIFLESKECENILKKQI